MADWQNWIDVGAVILAGVLGWAGGRRSVRRLVASLLSALVTEEAAKAIAPHLAPLLGKSLRAGLLGDMRQSLGEELRAALDTHRTALLEEVGRLLRAEGATREDLEEVSHRLAKVEGGLQVLTGQSGHHS